MREMKNSGVDWVGKIPIDWNIISFWQATKRISTGLNPRDNFELTKEDDYFYVTIRNFKNGKLFLDENCDRISKDAYGIIQKRSQLQQGDILFASISEEGNAYIIDNPPHNWNINESVFTIRPDNKRFINKYFYYHLINAGYYTDLRMDATGSTFHSIKQNKLRKSRIVMPPLMEQQKIVAFLDVKCQEVDTVIGKTRETINKYKELKQSIITEAVTKGIRGNRPMKDSGIKWIGDIPVEWNIRKGKWVLKKLERQIEEADGVITCFRDGEVTLRSKRREAGYTLSLQEVGYQGIEPGDLVVHGMDGFAGAIGISDSRGKGTPVLNVLDSTESKKYIMYFLRNMAYNGIFIALATGIRVRSCDTNWNKLKELLYLVPTLEEQKEIADYLDKKCAEIDALIAKKTALIEEMESYKKSVIYEYVTGKKEVPNG